MTLRAPYYQHEGVTIYHGDCLAVLPELPDNSVDLIVTDPPYFKVKSVAWDNQWDKPSDFLAWLDRVLVEFARTLKPNGSLYLFASPQMGARVECLVAGRFDVLNSITWRKPPFSTKAEMFAKEAMRAYFPASERIIFAGQLIGDDLARQEAGYDSQCEAAKRATFGDYLRGEMNRSGVSAKEVAALFPSASGGITGCVSNWLLGLNCPTPVQWLSIRARLNQGGGEFLRKEYEELRKEYEELRKEYEELRRPFSVSSKVPYTDVWDFETVGNHPGKHICEKPDPLLRHMIAASSKPGGVVLDAFGGSGSTANAARALGRSAISIEIDERWCLRQAQLLSQGSLF